MLKKKLVNNRIMYQCELKTKPLYFNSATGRQVDVRQQTLVIVCEFDPYTDRRMIAKGVRLARHKLQVMRNEFEKKWRLTTNPLKEQMCEEFVRPIIFNDPY